MLLSYTGSILWCYWLCSCLGEQNVCGKILFSQESSTTYLVPKIEAICDGEKKSSVDWEEPGSRRKNQNHYRAPEDTQHGPIDVHAKDPTTSSCDSFDEKYRNRIDKKCNSH